MHRRGPAAAAGFLLALALGASGWLVSAGLPAGMTDDPLVGRWVRGDGGAYDITPSGSGFTGTVAVEWRSGTGPCVHRVGQPIWVNIAAQGGGKYTGTNHGFSWTGNDPASCTDLPQTLTITLTGPNSLNYCVADQGCADLTRNPPVPTTSTTTTSATTATLPCAGATCGTNGADHLVCDTGMSCEGGKGNDVLDCSGGGTVCDGGLGNDTLMCDGGATCEGGAGADKLHCDGGECDGGAGNDTLTCGGNAVCRGGAGDDTLITVDGKRETADCGAGRDTAIVDKNDKTVGCEQFVKRYDLEISGPKGRVHVVDADPDNPTPLLAIAVENTYAAETSSPATLLRPIIKPETGSHSDTVVANRVYMKSFDGHRCVNGDLCEVPPLARGEHRSYILYLERLRPEKRRELREEAGFILVRFALEIRCRDDEIEIRCENNYFPQPAGNELIIHVGG